jgi:hypothetical protein
MFYCGEPMEHFVCCPEQLGTGRERRMAEEVSRIFSHLRNSPIGFPDHRRVVKKR